MDHLFLAKLQNTINEMNNLLQKDFIDSSNSRILMSRAIHQFNQLIVHIGYLESKILSLNEDVTDDF